MMSHKRWIGGLAMFPLIVIFMDAGIAIAQSSANYKMTKDVLDAAGVPSTSMNYKLEDAVGQPSAIGNSSSTNYSLSAGYFGAFEEVFQSQHFTFTANTGDSYSIVVNNATIDRTALSAGDEIGVFTPGDLCVGSSTWSGNTPLALTAWIDDPQTSDVDGYSAGENMVFKLWQQNSNTEYSANASYAQGNGTFGNGAFARVGLSSSGATDVEEGDNSQIPTAFHLSQNFPNPFNAGTIISYQIPEAVHVILRIYNVLGQEVIRLVDENQQPGIFRVRWTGMDKYGSAMPNGIYLYQITAGTNTAINKAAYLK